MTPTLSSTYSSDGYKFTFSSPGLFDLSFGFIITEGVGYALSLVAPTVFPLPAVSSTTFRSDYVTTISSSVASAEVRVLILDGVEISWERPNPRGALSTPPAIPRPWISIRRQWVRVEATMPSHA